MLVILLSHPSKTAGIGEFFGNVIIDYQLVLILTEFATWSAYAPKNAIRA